jgi:hypothetical protein
LLVLRPLLVLLVVLLLPPPPLARLLLGLLGRLPRVLLRRGRVRALMFRTSASRK